VANVMRVRTTISGFAGGPALNILHFSTSATDAPAAASCAAAAGAFWQVFTAQWATTTSFSTSGVVDVLDVVSGDLVNQFAGTSVTGAGILSGSDPLPPATQGLVRWSTSSFAFGRRVQGRTFIPALLESASTGVPSAGLNTTANSAISGLLAAVPDLVIYSRPVESDPSHVPPITSRPGGIGLVTGGTLINKFAVLRSRRD
jgi:hypothetical protein